MPRHEEQKTLAYTADELFSVVANVKDYPSFVPWCTGARIHRETPKEIIAELEIGFGPFRESFTSQVTLDRPRQVLVRATEGGPLEHLTNSWTFTPAGDKNSCGPRCRLPIQEPPPRSCGQHDVPRGLDSHDGRLRIARAPGPSDDAASKAASIFLTRVGLEFAGESVQPQRPQSVFFAAELPAAAACYGTTFAGQASTAPLLAPQSSKFITV